MRVTKRPAFLMVLALLSACSGGGSGGAGVAPASALKAPSNATTRTQMVKMSFTVPADLGSRAIGATGQSRSLQFTAPEVMSVVAVQLCSQAETNTATNNGVTSCKNGSIFDTVYDVTNPAVCPSYAPHTTFPCTINFPAAASSGSQFELDLYDRKPTGGNNGVGGVLPVGTASAIRNGIRDYDCSVTLTFNPVSTARKLEADGGGTGGTCLLGAALSDPQIAVPLNPNQPAVQINQVEGMIAKIALTPTPFFASYAGPGGNGQISGASGGLTFDAANSNITQSGSCVQDNGNEFGNATTPSIDEAPVGSPPGFDQVTGNVSGAGYHRNNGGVINPATGIGPVNAINIAASEYAAGGNPLTNFYYLPCLVGYTGPPFPGINFTGLAPGINLAATSAAVNFPNDKVTFQYDNTGNIPNATQVGQYWDPASNTTGVPNDPTVSPKVPYYALLEAITRGYQSYEFLGGTNCVEGSASPCGTFGYGTSNSHFLDPVLVTFVLTPLWGQVGNLQPGCAPASCTVPFTSSDLDFTQNPAGGSYTPIVNMQGTNSTAQVAALQYVAPTGGSYSATLATGSNPCTGVVAFNSAPDASPAFLFSGSGGRLWTFTGQFSNSPGLTCTVTFSDGFNSFNVTFTNTGKQNPVPTPAPTPTPSPPPYGGPTAPANPPII